MLNFGGMRQIAIFAILLLVAACDTKILDECPRKVTISPLQPVKFWPVDCQTYNEKEVCGIHPKCWCQPFECDDEIKVQFQDDTNGLFTLFIYDENDNEIDSIPFGSNVVLDQLSNFVTNGGFGTAWVSGSHPSIASIPVLGSSEILRGLITGAENNQDYSFNFSVNATGAYDLEFYFLDESFGIIATSSIPFLDNNTSGNVTLNAPSGNITYLGVKISNDGAGSLTGISVQSIEYSPVSSMDMLETFVTNGGAGTAWVSSANPSIASIGVFGGSEILRGKFHNAEPGKSYSFNYSINATGLYTISFYFLNSSFGITSSFETPVTSAANSTGSVTLNGTGASYFGIALTNQSPSSSLTGVSVQSIDFIEPTESIVYYTSFIPSEHDICDQVISLKIKDGGEVIYKSDCLDIRENHECTELIQYKNNRNYNGLAFNNGSPDTTFNIRIPMVFFHERGQEEDLVSEDNQQTIHLSGKDVEQRRMDTDYMPYYMHHRLRKILKMQTVFIDETFWTKEAAYDIQDGKKTYPLKRAECWLTKKTSIVRSIL